MAATVALVVGFLAARLSWLLLRPGVLAAPVLRRTNYRGRTLPTAGGLVVVVAVLAVEGGRVVAAAVTGSASPATGGGSGAGRSAVLLVVVGMGLLGLVDDLAGAGPAEPGGFRGHLRSVASGRPTTGALKLFGGAAVAVVAVAVAPTHAAGAGAGVSRLVVDAALVALAANVGNLFDRAPGRTIKVTVATFAVVALTAGVTAAVTGTPAPTLVAPAVVVGAGLGLLLDDLHERVMLGDTGANVLGGVAGLAVVLAASPSVRLGTLAGVLALNVASEWVSFSRIIDGFGPLRVIDRSGRRDR